MPTARSRRGLKGEIIAATELGRRGYRIIESNYRCRYGEIDLIAMDGDALVFVEVKSRKSCRFGIPAESITALKREKLLITAEHYLQAKNLSLLVCRFDVVSIIFRDGVEPEVEIIQNAFVD